MSTTINPIENFPSLRTDPPVAPGINPNKSSVARIYDFYLGGQYNYPADRQMATYVKSLFPITEQAARENRAFLRRTIQYMADHGIRQFLDIGSGIPTQANTHEVAQEAAGPDEAVHVVYVDKDPVVPMIGNEIMKQSGRAQNRDSRTVFVLGDALRPETILTDPEVTATIDFSKPVGVICLALFHFFTNGQIKATMDTIRNVLAPGSFVSATHAAAMRNAKPEDVVQVEIKYKQLGAPVIFKKPAEIELIWSGLELIEPGVVPTTEWKTGKDQDSAFRGGLGRKI